MSLLGKAPCMPLHARSLCAFPCLVVTLQCSYAQKGLSAKQPEVTALVDAVMDGKVHKDYVSLGGQQYMITTVTEASFYGRSISTAASGGIVLVKTARFLVVGVYTEPATAAQVVPHVHRFAQELPKLVGPP